MKASSKTPFDKEAVYDQEIAPLMAKIIAICKEHELPMLASFNYGHGRQADDPGGDEFATTYLHDGKHDWWAPDELVEALKIIRHGASTRTKMFAITVTQKHPHENPA